MSVKVWLKANQAPISFTGNCTFTLIDSVVLQVKRDGTIVALFSEGTWGWVIDDQKSD